YIEVYNRSENPINLNGWKFTDGSSVATLPDKIMLPNDYLILTSTSNVAKFGLTANVLGIANFPTLNNTSDNLVLKESGDQTIDSVAYDLSWYRNSDKEEGGWSLEIIDPNNICSEAENWTSSENESGGTPGKINSVFANKPDLTGPQLISVSVQAANKVLLTFNEKLEKQISGSVSFLISPNPEIAVYYFENPTLRSIILELSSALVTKQLYTVTVTGLYDCSGNVMDPEKNKLTFALPEEAEVSDILINEILFNPRPNGVDFVELYNNSSKYIDLKDWSVGNFTDGLVENSKLLFSTPQIIAPGEYLTLTSDPLVLKNNYPQGKENAFYKTTLPSLPDDEGSIAIVSSQGEVIDYFLYDKNLHSELLKDDEGVSLERISFSENTNNNANWTSATSVSGFATPGFQNSNLRLDNNLLSDEVTINPVVFNPNAGNFSQINFRFNQGGFVANVKILDHHGRLIKTLANNSTIGQEGFFRWDGDQNDGGKARTGYYVVWFEVFDITGIQKTFRKRIVLASL
ncbi:MAG: lamin tail domain-containing protein, partial [Cyclobacteriaceae bacterium]